MAPTPCVPCCSTPQTVNIPGRQGDPGANGANGVNAVSILSAGFLAVGAGNTHSLAVTSSQWMAIGQILVADGPVHLVVVSTPTLTLVQATELGYAGDVTGAVAAGARISPAGVGSTVWRSGTATLVGGTVTVAATLSAASKIILSRNTEAGTPGFLEAPAASRNVGAGTFAINSSEAADTSTVDWLVIG